MVHAKTVKQGIMERDLILPFVISKHVLIGRELMKWDIVRLVLIIKFIHRTNSNAKTKSVLRGKELPTMHSASTVGISRSLILKIRRCAK